MKLALIFCFFWFFFYSFTLGEDNPPKPVDSKLILDLLDSADKIKFNKVRNNKRILIFETTNKKDIAELKLCIELNPHNANKKCTCKDNANKNGGQNYDYSFQLIKDNKLTIEIEIYNGNELGCNLWDQKGAIANLDKWYSWFDAHKVIRPKHEPTFFGKNQDDILIFRDRWLEGMPLSIRPLWAFQNEAPFKPIEIKDFIEPLKKEFPNQNKRILAILSWYGSGAGSWGPCPDYEIVGEKMLLEYKTADIATAIESIPKLTDTQKEGAVRYFSSYYSSHERRNIKELKAPTREILWDFVKTTKDENKLSFAKMAFKK